MRDLPETDEIRQTLLLLPQTEDFLKRSPFTTISVQGLKGDHLIGGRFNTRPLRRSDSLRHFSLAKISRTGY
jgi:hypothetical protein